MIPPEFIYRLTSNSVWVGFKSNQSINQNISRRRPISEGLSKYMGWRLGGAVKATSPGSLMIPKKWWVFVPVLITPSIFKKHVVFLTVLAPSNCYRTMITTGYHPTPRLLDAGFLAFSPPRSFSTKDEPLRASSPPCYSVIFAARAAVDQHLRSDPTQQLAYNRQTDTCRCYRGKSVSCSGLHQRRSVSYLRGGGNDVDHEPHAAANEAPNDERSDTYESKTVVRCSTDINVPNKNYSLNEQRRETSSTAEGKAFGVALVTERSTATGGSRGRVRYSVLDDGSLHVARFGKPSSALQVPRPIQALPATHSSPSHVDKTAAGDSESTLPMGRLHTAGPRTLLHECRRCFHQLKTGVCKVLEAAAHEARAVAVGAGEQVTRAGLAVRGGLMNTFLPAGYPASVRPEYVRYRSWDILQDLSSHLRGVLATQAVLEGMGVGRAESTPLAATLQWMARDGASMIGGLLFTSAASANFGVNIKTWRLFADASNDVGLALEMLAPLPAFRQGGRFLRLICLASVFKAACGVAAGATAAAITEHWAVDNNIADVGAKNGAQHTVASLLGLGLSFWFARAVSDAGSASGSRVWGWYLALTVVHLLANYVAMRTLALRSLNPSRASLLVSDYLSKTLTVPGTGHGASDPDDGVREENKDNPDWMGRTFGTRAAHVLSPSAAAYRERIFLLPGWMRALKPWGDVLQINVGVPVGCLAREADDLLWLTSLYHDEKAMVDVQVSYQPLGPRMGTKINLALREDASSEDRLQAMFQANVIRCLLARDPDGIPQGGDGVERTLFLRKVTEEALRVTRREFPYFREALIREGWDLSRVILGGGPWLGRWGSLGKED